MLVNFKTIIVIMTLWTPTFSSKFDLLQNYTKESPPNETLTVVKISFSALHIIDFDDKNGKFTVSGYLELSWVDPRIAVNWASSEFFQTKNFSIYFKDSEVWTPEIRHNNPYSRSDFEKMAEETVMFQRNGSALMIKMEVFTTECKTNFYYFPFDTQNCSIDLVMWGFFMGETVLKTRKNKVNRRLYEENNVWKLEDARITVGSINGFGDTETTKVSSAKINFRIRRNASYYVYFLIVPFIMMQFLQPFVFWMPWNSVERSSFSITVLLAIAVYLTLVADNIPKSSRSEHSYVGIKMVIDLCIGVYVQLCVIVTHVLHMKSKIYRTLSTPAPKKIQKKKSDG